MKKKSRLSIEVQSRNSVMRTTSDGQSTYQQQILKNKTDADIKECKKELDIDDHYITLERLIHR